MRIVILTQSSLYNSLQILTSDDMIKLSFTYNRSHLPSQNVVHYLRQTI